MNSSWETLVEAPTEDTRHRARIADLERERDQLLAMVTLLEELSTERDFVGAMRRVSQCLGTLFGLDRCSIFIAGATDVRLVATFENPALSNLVVDLDRYPELKLAFESGSTLVIADAANDPRLGATRDVLVGRNVESIVVVPMHWQGAMIGAICLRTERGGRQVGTADITFCEAVAVLAARTLAHAHRISELERMAERERQLRVVERHHVTLVAFLQRLLAAHAGGTLAPSDDSSLAHLVSATLEGLAQDAAAPVDL